MHKITLAFSPVLLYIVLRADAVRHFPADAMRPPENRNSQKPRFKQRGSSLQRPKERGI